MEMVNGGIFGPKLSGKTTLAKTISRKLYESPRQTRTLVLDPLADEWGEQAMVFTDEDKFWKAAWNVNDCLIVCDEAAETIARDKELIPVFTRMRHNRHKLLIIGHSGMSLLPIMREQIDTVYLFRQSEKAAKVWAEVMTNNGLLQATELNQYEFIQHRLYGKPRKLKLKL